MPTSRPLDTVDFDLSGIVGVRLEAPLLEGDVIAAGRTLGEPPGSLDRPPDIRVRFARELAPGDLCWVEPDRFGFSDQGFFVITSSRRPARARISFDEPGGGWALVTESGRRSLPHLLPMVRLAAFGHAWVPLHAAAFQVEGLGVLASGWAHGGKTSALLAFMERGARYVADDWTLLSADGTRMRGLSGALSLTDEQLARTPLGPAHVRGGLLRRAAAWSGRALPALVPGRGRGGALARVAERVGGALERRARRSVEPEEVFGERLDLATPRVLFIMMRHEARRVSVEAVPPREAAARLASASGFEELPFLGCSLAYRFAFPERPGAAFVERAAELRLQLLEGALAGLSAFVVRHPRAADPAALHQAMARCLEESR
jgi:hypothetical protein